MKVGHSKVCVDLSMLLFSFSPELWYRQVLGTPQCSSGSSSGAGEPSEGLFMVVLSHLFHSF